MYFKDKNNTNIDSEFSNDSFLSKIFKFISKYKLFLIIFLIVIIGIIFLFIMFGNNNSSSNYYLVLDGESVVTIYKGSDYIEPGYKAYNSLYEDLTKDVKIDSNLDVKVIGEYQISYKIGSVVKTRKIIVVEKPLVNTFIRLNTINNDVNVFLSVGEEYKEPGYQVFSSTGKDLNNQVKVIGEVNTSKKGTYILTYTLIDQNGITITANRTVIVMDTSINLSLSISDWTNEFVKINVNVDSEYFDYIILPDGRKVNESIYLYKALENGEYIFKAYSSKGGMKESSIKVNNINKTKPTGSCSGSFDNGVSVININASDDIGIKRYEIDGNSYSSSKITLNKEVSSVFVKIYDKANNMAEITCNLKDNNQAILFGKNIKLNYSFVKDNSMWYSLYSPNVDNGNKKIPMIVWLHGSGEVGASESGLKNSGLLKVLNNWKLEGFNAVVLCPRLSSGEWNNGNVKNKLFSLIDKIALEKNIDKNKIIIAGHSLGGIGAQYMTYYGQDYFSSMVVLSGYNSGVDLNKIKDISVKGYVESTGNSYNFMIGKFSNVFGRDNVFVLNTSHTNVPNVAFNEDKNGDGRSDLIEWMLLQNKK